MTAVSAAAVETGVASLTGLDCSALSFVSVSASGFGSDVATSFLSLSSEAVVVVATGAAVVVVATGAAVGVVATGAAVGEKNESPGASVSAAKR